jgi:hypothetical protein
MTPALAAVAVRVVLATILHLLAAQAMPAPVVWEWPMV